MKHTKRKYNKKNKTHHKKKRRNHNKTKKIIFINKSKKTRKYQRGSGKYKPSDIYGIDQFITNDCLNILKSNPNRSDSGMLNKMFTSKKNDPYVKCRRSIAVLNTEKMPPAEYLKYREIIKVTKNDPYYSNPDDPNRDDVEKIGKKYIFDYIFKLHSDVINGNSNLKELLKVISPCYLIYVLTYQNYTEYITRLQEISQMNRTKGKIISAAGPTAKTFANIDRIYEWVRQTNFDLFKLRTPQDLTNLFNSYYPINCPYKERLKEFQMVNIESRQILETNTRYTNNSSWDLYLNITFSNFYNAYFSKDRYDTSIVYSSLIGESFIRRLSTNIIDKNGDIIFKSTDGDGDFYEYNKDKFVFDKDDFTKKHFNEFILKLNEIGGSNKFDNTEINYEDKTTIGTSLPDRLIGTLNYKSVVSNSFIENIVKFLAISMMPIIINVTRIIIGSRENYYGLFYHYYQEKRDGDCYFLYNNINERNNVPITKTETEIINNFINANIPNDKYNKCTEDLRKYNSDNLYPDCRIIDIQNNALFCFAQTLITLPFHPFPVIGRYIQIMKYENILSDSVNDVVVSANSLILWSGNINMTTVDDVFNEETSQYVSKELSFGDVIQSNVGYTFYEGFLKPILSSLKPQERIQTPVNSQDTTPRNTISQNDIPLQGFFRGSNESIGSTVELG